jgi:uncharacterized protein YvpB
MNARYLYGKYKMLVFVTASFFMTLIILLLGIVHSQNQGNARPDGVLTAFEGRDTNLIAGLEPVDYSGYGEEFADSFTGGGQPAVLVAEENGRIFKRQEIRLINQHAVNMPNGCETVSLAMVLGRYLPDITPREIAENFLPRSGLPAYDQGILKAEDPARYFIGDPAGRGYGIFAPGLAKAARDTLEAYGLSLEVLDISGCSEEELFSHAGDGYPVIVWIPMRLAAVSWGTAASWHLPDHSYHRWPSPMHCAVLVDFDEASVTLYDPTVGIVEYNRELFVRRWGEIGPSEDDTRHAVVIRSSGG